MSPGEVRFGNCRLSKSGRKTGMWQKYCLGCAGVRKGKDGGKKHKVRGDHRGLGAQSQEVLVKWWGVTEVSGWLGLRRQGTAVKTGAGQ